MHRALHRVRAEGSQFGQYGGDFLLHSLFDYPLRTAGLAAVFALCLALLAGARGAAPRSSADNEQVRHATL